MKTSTIPEDARRGLPKTDRLSQDFFRETGIAVQSVPAAAISFSGPPTSTVSRMDVPTKYLAWAISQASGCETPAIMPLLMHF